MSNSELLELLKSALREVAPKHGELAERLCLETSLADLGLDSLCITGMLGVVEKELGILVPDEEIAPVFDVAAFIALIQRHLTLQYRA